MAHQHLAPVVELHAVFLLQLGKRPLKFLHAWILTVRNAVARPKLLRCADG
jgi:hypothetical protein